MMTIPRSTMLRTCIAVTFALGLGATTQTFADTITLNLNSQWPANDVRSEVNKWMSDEVEKRTDGQVVIKNYFGEGLGSANENLSLLRTGAIDMAVFSASYFPSELPFNAAPNQMPMALDSVKQAKVLMERLIDEVPAFREEQERHGIRSLYFNNLNEYYLISKEPVTSVEDMEGLRVRTWGSEMPRMVEAAGGTAVTLSMPEVYESLDRGVIDAAPFSYDLIENYRLYEVADHVTKVPLFVGPTSGVWISDDAWERLSGEQQEILLDVSDEALERDFEAVTSAAEESKEYLEEQGMTIHTFPDGELEKWMEANPDFFGDWIAEMEENGKGDDARRAAEIWQEVRENVD